MALLADVLLQGTRAAQPAATTVADGTLYYVTDEFVLEQSAATTWSAYSGTSGSLGINQLTGDVTAGPGTGSEVATIANLAVATGKLANNAVTDAKFRQGAALSVVGVTGNATANVADIVAATDNQVMRRSGTAVAWGAVNLASSDAVTGVLPNANLSTQAKTHVITLIIDGGGSVITTGNKGYVSCPYTGTITGAKLLSIDGTGPATAGSIVVDVWKDTYANFPPTVADTITAAAKPTLSAANKSDDTTLTGWTTAVTAGDVFGFNVDSATTVLKVLLQLTIVLA